MSEMTLRREGIAVMPPAAMPRYHPWASNLDVAVDLGDALGSLRWWRGLLTLALLALAAAHCFRAPSPLPAPAPASVPQADATLRLTIAPLALGGAARAVPVPMSPAVIRLAEPPERPRIAATARLAQSGGVVSALVRAGVGQAEAEDVVALASAQADLRQLKPGTAFDMILGRRETKTVPRPLERLVFRAAFDLKLAVKRAADGVLALDRIPIAIDRTPLRIEASVGRGFHGSARDAGLPAPMAAEIARLAAHRLDFERDVRARDRFTAVIAHQRAETGETIVGDLLYARLDRAKGEPLEMVRWPYAGRQLWFLADGSAVKKGLMQTPVVGARLTSGFGLRIHPILGYSRFHRGVDFGAGMGTPIVAAAAGRIGFAGWHGGHGLYVRVDHAKALATAYGHMSRVAVKPGQSVAQGQLLGFVGSTGISTGPHLHYELWKNGVPANPSNVSYETVQQLSGQDLATFKARVAKLMALPAGSGN